MLARVPVVATDADGTREVCVPKPGGSCPSDVEALRSALQHHLDIHCSQQWADRLKLWFEPSSEMPWSTFGDAVCQVVG